MSPPNGPARAIRRLYRGSAAGLTRVDEAPQLLVIVASRNADHGAQLHEYGRLTPDRGIKPRRRFCAPGAWKKRALAGAKMAAQILKARTDTMICVARLTGENKVATAHGPAEVVFVVAHQVDLVLVEVQPFPPDSEVGPLLPSAVEIAV